MKNKDFKLLIERFNRFLLKENQGHTTQCLYIIRSVPSEFNNYINENTNWYSGGVWLDGDKDKWDGDQDAEDDQILLFEEVAKACGCEVNELLVNDVDGFVNDVNNYNSSSSSQIRMHPDVFLNSYMPSSNLHGSFEINGVPLTGFYYMPGSTCGLESQFLCVESPKEFEGLLFVAPTSSVNISRTRMQTANSSKRFKSSLGGVWG